MNHNIYGDNGVDGAPVGRTYWVEAPARPIPLRPVPLRSQQQARRTRGAPAAGLAILLGTALFAGAIGLGHSMMAFNRFDRSMTPSQMQGFGFTWSQGTGPFGPRHGGDDTMGGGSADIH